LAASDLGLYRHAYESLLIPVNFIQQIPYVNNTSDPLWKNCESHWPNIEAQLQQYADDTAAIIVEPILQGAGGMQIYSQDFLKRLSEWAKTNNIYLIADEIMTGMGRCGYPLACQHANIQPDFVCLGKGLTAGWLPLSAVLTTDAVYDLFYQTEKRADAFLHSHTFSGNVLAAAVANACFDIVENEKIDETVRMNSDYLQENMLAVSENTGKLKNIRHIGWVVAADLITDDPNAGQRVYQQAVADGALLRPLGNTLYWLPPLNCGREVLDQLRDITISAIEKTTI